jgi:hypothetical protein
MTFYEPVNGSGEKRTILANRVAESSLITKRIGVLIIT